jgi:hypothetical protein
MLQAAAAARILNRQDNLEARLALETAISVCYARPWIGSNRGGKLKEKKWLPRGGSDRELHDRLLKLRRQTYAHTDPAGGRKAFAQRGSEGGLAIGARMSLSVGDLPAIIALCERHEAIFRQALEDELGTASPT